jgi:predicted lipoprotein with Yx(FWY)xxD motif
MTPQPTNEVLRHDGSRFRGRRRGGRAALLVGAAAVALSMSAVGASAAAAAPVRSAPHAAPIVVKVGHRTGVGRILVTEHTGATLYIDTNDGPNMPTCTGECASVWPPFVLPKGDTKAVGGPGVSGLGTVKTSGGLQVTYHKKPLYKFTGDSGHSVNGNDDGPFEVVKLPRSTPPGGWGSW